MMIDDDDGQMRFGDPGGLKLPNICLTREEIPEKTSPRKLAPTGDRTRACCVTDAHVNAWSTAVDTVIRSQFRGAPQSYSYDIIAADGGERECDNKLLRQISATETPISLSRDCHGRSYVVGREKSTEGNIRPFICP